MQPYRSTVLYESVPPLVGVHRFDTLQQILESSKSCAFLKSSQLLCALDRRIEVTRLEIGLLHGVADHPHQALTSLLLVIHCSFRRSLRTVTRCGTASHYTSSGWHTLLLSHLKFPCDKNCFLSCFVLEEMPNVEIFERSLRRCLQPRRSEPCHRVPAISTLTVHL
ncbi:hypothetical protein AUEXF2481DRAFT_160265 [Aureobasidium subglaciale EXF-2481]|uniref:Uncharacterized protein n=1 Tax=Aureobasidium subglaciale (strain EXF-2481) TaxID=1043005 RepID=A0A074YSY3_AURSE|nr:uncharacterized protein AUEXF2481DRAFT_160265 [Aureobasidium subglaciale EXF-2481]KER00796.1 hypothetical protein AUEXF2481DRAFT_160265 [Aureobasidium subglaciale EXF-2481]